MRSRLAVVAPDVADVVTSIGGWLFDRVTSGWDVTVIVDDHSDTRPLQILGTTPVDLESALTATVRDPLPHALVVSSAMFERDDRVRRGVLATMDAGSIDVNVWGPGWPAALHGFAPVEHRLSCAARAFKSQALLAAGVPVDVARTETVLGRVPAPSDRRRGLTSVGQPSAGWSCRQRSANDNTARW